VYFHLWCDRLACREHADAPHDCEQFKGESGSEEESAEREVTADVLLGPEWARCPVVTLAPPTSLTLADMEAASAAVRARREAPVGEQDGEQDEVDAWLHAANESLIASLEDLPQVVPWWRRMLGGTR
jgi:hypothetical protein